MNTQNLFDTIKRDAVTIVSEESLREKLSGGQKLVVKFGADPSRPDLHLGHSVPLRKLKLFQDAGHDVVFVIGDFTAMIGDPSGRSKARPALTFDETRQNAKSYFEQVAKILDPGRIRVVYNSQWLGPMSFSDVIALTGKYTVARILERDDFAVRFSGNQPIGLHETLYPLMQGYDSVALRADIEVGGTDQTFNLLVGRELQRDYGQPPQVVLTFPLLPGLDGVEKMSKSLDNYIGLDESPETMFEKCMKVPDNLLSEYFRLTTDVEEGKLEVILSGDIREAHFVYAHEIVTMYHGEAAARAARERYLDVAMGCMPEEMETIRCSGGAMGLLDALRLTGLASSNAEARRLITGGGIRVDGETVKDTALVLPAPSEHVLCRGKNRFVRIVLC